MSFVVKCKHCKRAWDSEAFCDKCRTPKQVFVLAESEIDMEDTLQRTYRLVQALVKKFEAELDDDKLNTKYNDAFAKRMRALGKTVIELSQEVRASERAAASRTKKLSHDEQAKLMADYFATWPERLQGTFLEAIKRHFKTRKYGAAQEAQAPREDGQDA